jgi:conjugative relaxase-like TrwC/TraI family protein
MMTIHKLTAGDGYTYLTRHVAGADIERARGQSAADYYTAEGNPPGRWIGRGAPLLDLAGEVVTETQMRNLFGEGKHPNADELIAAYLAEHVSADLTDRQLAALTAKASQRATLGRAFPAYEPLAAFESRAQQRLAVIADETGRPPTDIEIKKVRAEESRRQRAAVAGFDVVFAPVKSAALLWALHRDASVRAAVWEAHQEAMTGALELLENHAAFTRTGAGGVAQIATNGLIAAAFDHYDSRAGDPNPHTHVAVSCKVQGVDGVWRSLDARGLYRLTVAASEQYNTAFETALTARLGVRFADRPDTVGSREPVREIVGVPVAFIEHFSSRRTEIEARYEQLVRDFRREHGHDPPRATCHQLARQANLDTREGKKAARSLARMRADWTQSLTEEFGASAVDRLTTAVPEAETRPIDTAEIDVSGLAAQVVARVAEQRSTWTRWNLHAEAERLVRRSVMFGTQTAHREVVNAVVAEAVSPRLSTRIDAVSLLDEPPLLRRADHESVFTQHAAERYTSQAVLDAESRLLRAAAAPTGMGISPLCVALSLRGFEARGQGLDSGQRALVTAFATDSRRLVVGLGPAGSGKTTAMRALVHVVGAAGRRVVPLATSAASAAVLAADLGVPAENVHKFLCVNGRLGATEPSVVAGSSGVVRSPFELRAGDLVLVDEAGMAGTPNLDRLVSLAEERGAIVRLLGDYRQLGAVESGGALRLIAHEAGAVELTAVRRFRNPAEAAATVQIRVGDTAALDFYFENRRVQAGSKEAMIEAAYAGWKADMLAGKTTLMAAATNSTVAALAARARDDRVEAGQVEAEGVRLTDGNLAGVGDWIVTRHNDRRLAAGRHDWVKNGDAWQVLSRLDDGALRVRHLGHSARAVLPAEYVERHVALLYATTAHRAQGITVDTAHPVVTGTMSREVLYVVASRARERTTLYVSTHELLPFEPDERLDRVKNDERMYAAREVLEAVLAHEGNELSATESIREAQREAESLATLVPRYVHAQQVINAERFGRAARIALGDELAESLGADSGWPDLVRALGHAEAAGWQPERVLAAAGRRRELDSAESPARVLAWRIDAHVRDRKAPLWLARPALADAARYADLLAASVGQLDAESATSVPAALRADDVPDTAQPPVVGREIVGPVLGAAAAERAEGEPAWPALVAALRRVERSGRDPVAMLRTVAGARELDSAASLSEVLAWRLGRSHGQAPAAHACDQAESWRTLAWALKAAENNGVPAETVLAVVPGRDLADVLRHVAAAVGAVTSQQLDAALPPWLSPPPQSVARRDPELGVYLEGARAAIGGRMNELAQHVIRDQPGWARTLGPAPRDPDARAAWLWHIGVAAAYREQHRITTNDRRQPLGPYVESWLDEHTAYWRAVASIVAASELAGRHAAAPPDRERGQLAADIYRALPASERASVTADLAARLGTLWFGKTSAPDDEAALHPAYAAHLAAALVRRGHLKEATTKPNPPLELHLAARRRTAKSAHRAARAGQSHGGGVTERRGPRQAPILGRHRSRWPELGDQSQEQSPATLERTQGTHPVP